MKNPLMAKLEAELDASRADVTRWKSAFTGAVEANAEVERELANTIMIMERKEKEREAWFIEAGRRQMALAKATCEIESLRAELAALKALKEKQ